MRRRNALARSAAIVALLCATRAAAPAAAQGLQTGRIVIEAVAAVTTSSSEADDPFVFLDLTTTMRVNESLDVIVRPWARRLPGGDWDVLFYQAQIRYQPVDRLRIDAGILSSTLGMATLEMRQDLNPAVGSPFYYFGPVPRFDPQADRLQVLSGGYPLGAIVSSSGSWWDARGGVVDGTPARYRNVIASNNPSPAPQLVAGGGVTPRPGFRLGVGVAHGAYRDQDDTDYYDTSYPLPDADATVFTVEGEFAVRYTRLTGEWVRDRFEKHDHAGDYPRLLSSGRADADAAAFRGVARYSRVDAGADREPSACERTRSQFEFSGGYRLTPGLDPQGRLRSVAPLRRNDWAHAATLSVVWGKRWF